MISVSRPFARHKKTQDWVERISGTLMAGATPLYTSMLLLEMFKRQRRNPRYSLRAFCRDIRLNQGHFSRLLRGVGTIRVSTAIRIAQTLEMTEEETNAFVGSVKKQMQK